MELIFVVPVAFVLIALFGWWAVGVLVVGLAWRWRAVQ